ncbi:TatD family hydrolase [Shewanella gaetbuli]
MNLTNSFFDSHSHFDDCAFDEDRDAVFEQMKAANIKHMLIPGICQQRWQKQINIAHQYQCFYALGIHPWFIPDNIDAAITELAKLIELHQHQRLFVALGECGLDKLKPNFEQQRVLFERQLQLAQTFQLPVIIHCVKCHSEVINLLKHYSLSAGGVIHGFYGSVETAKQYQTLGFKLGIGGLLLNKNAKKLQKAVAELPLDLFLLETDSPSMTPQKYQPNRNSSLILPEIAAEIANLHKKTTVFIMEQLSSNAMQLFDP